MAAAHWQERDWHGHDAVGLDDGLLEVVIVPEPGGRIVSLRHSASGHEWLIRGQPNHAPSYGDRYVSPGMGGWDEMVPTIDACAYPVPGVAHGRPIPDHGEAWSRAWTVNTDEGSVTMATSGVALPYTLTRTVRSVRPGVLEFRYRMESRSLDPVAFLWAAHPLFARGPGTALVLPDDVTSVDLVGGSRTGTTWAISDAALLASTEADPSVPCAIKFYVPVGTPVSWASLEERDLGVSLRLDWDKDLTPYLGVWIDRRQYTSSGAIAIEPTNGYFDDLGRAWLARRCATVSEQAAVEWWLTVTLGGIRAQDGA